MLIMEKAEKKNIDWNIVLYWRTCFRWLILFSGYCAIYHSLIFCLHLSPSLHRSFLTGPLSQAETKTQPSSGRASPLVSAGQVLDKYFTLSKHQKDHQSTLHKSKAGLGPDVRQGALMCCFRMTLCCINYKGTRYTWQIVCHFLARETTFMTPYLLSCAPSPFWKGVCSKRKGFAPKGSKFFPIRADPFSEGDKTKLTELPPCWQCINSP